MNKAFVLVMRDDVVYYPPVLSIINVLLELNYKVSYIGVYSDVEQKTKLINRGVSFFDTIIYDGKGSVLKKTYQLFHFKRQVKRYLDEIEKNNDFFLWVLQADTICVLHSLLNKYKTILHLLEYVDPSINWKYKMLFPGFSMKKALHDAASVICCEYNRSQITKGLFDLEIPPFVLPNKPYIQYENEDVPEDVLSLVNTLYNKIYGKKVILYQGVFVNKERRLEEFCQAVNEMPDEYVLIAMGKGSDMYDRLKEKFESEKIIFIPFVRPPYHLLITQLASIGVLSYFARSNSIASVLNPLYCAPNKIFEYTKYGIPMIANDIPGLHYAFFEYKCGECVQYPMTPDAIKKVIYRIFENYNLYSNGALEYYKSVNFRSIVEDIISSLR